MFGVVLWSDPQERKAVIWCEDHGDLAFYRQSENSTDSVCALDAGDLVQFEVTMDRQLRLAHNPQLVVEGSHSELAQALADGQVKSSSLQHEKIATSRSSAEIIPFARYSAARATEPCEERIGLTV